MRRIAMGFLLGVAMTMTAGSWAADKPKAKEKSSETMAGLIQKGEYQRAVDMGKAAIVAKKVDESIYLNLGMAYFQLKDYTNSVASYEEASKLNPLNTQPFLLEATAYHAMGLDDKAAEAFRRAIEIDPTNKDVRYNEAQVLEKQGKVEDALVHYEEIYRLDPGFKDVAYATGLIYYNKAQYGQAVPYFDKALSLHPGDQDVLLAQGQNYMNAKQYDKAIPVMKAFLDVTKNENYKPTITSNIAGLYMKQADAALESVKNSKDKVAIAQADATAKEAYSNSIVYYDKLLLLRPNSESALEAKARALDKVDKSQEALVVLKQYLSVSKNETEKKVVAQRIKEIEAQLKKK